MDKQNESFLNEIYKYNPEEFPKIDYRSLNMQHSKSSKEFKSHKVEQKLNQVLLLTLILFLQKYAV